MTSQIINYALFSSHVYDGDFNTDQQSGVYSPGIDTQFNGATVKASYVSADTGFGGVAYQRGNEIIITFEGTNGSIEARSHGL